MTNHYYIDSNYGSSTTDTPYATRQTGAYSALTGTNVYASLSDFVTYATPVDGDFIYVSDAHSKDYAVDTILDFGGNDLYVVCTQASNCDTLSTGAVETTGSGGAATDDLEFRGNSSKLIIYGFDFGCQNRLLFNSTNMRWNLIACVCRKETSSSGSLITTFLRGAYIEFLGCNFHKLTVGDYFYVGYGTVIHLRNCGGVIGTTKTNRLVTIGYNGGRCIIEDMDITELLISTGDILDQANAARGYFICELHKCLLPANWGWVNSGDTLFEYDLSLDCCSDTAGNYYESYRRNGMGELSRDIANYLNDASTTYDGTNEYSLHIATSAEAFRAAPFRCLVAKIPASDLSVSGGTTLTFEIISDATLTDYDVALFVRHPTSAANWVKGTVVDSLPTDFALIGTPSNLTASTASLWTETYTGEVAQKIAITIPQLTSVDNAEVEIWCEVYKPNQSLNISPVPAVT